MEPQYSFRPPYHREDAGASERLVPAIVLIAVGAIFLLNNLHLVYAHDLLRYWPAILIAVGIVKLVDSPDTSGRVGGGVLVGLGAVFLAQSLGFLDVRFWDLWPLILIAIGLAMLFESNLAWHIGMKTKTSAGGAKEAAVFSGGKRIINDQNFRGAKFDAVFGGFEIDLRRANIIEDEAVLDLNAVFGGIEVKVPESWSVVVKGAGVFGAFQDSTMQPDPRIYPSPKRLVVKGGAVFGGVELKN
jgi:cell wall-active antibiotic response 4TMS protein YvqF